MQITTISRNWKKFYDSARYNDVLDEIRTQMAKAYLQQPGVALVEISHLLAFSEQSSFTRAFKRWTGMGPVEYRKKVLLGAEHA